MLHSDEKKKYFQQFYCERLTLKQENSQIIEYFSATAEGKNLEGFLKSAAWEADCNGETVVYLVKDKTNNVALFFSIKCALLYECYQYDKLDSDRQEFVNLLVDAILSKNNTALTGYQDSGMYSESEMKRLFSIAHDRVDLKLEERSMNDGDSVLKVAKSHAAIEIQHFCRNAAYAVDSHVNVSLGFGIFWEVIVPFISEITSKIGCEYLYLFAADNSEDKEVRKLVRYYKMDLKFCDIENLMLIKPWYDKNCLGLIQKVSELQNNRQHAWAEFLDIPDGAS